MASGVKFKWSKAGYNEVMKDPGIQSMLHEIGEQVKDNATTAYYGQFHEGRRSYRWYTNASRWDNPPYEIYDDTADRGKLAGRPVVHVATNNPTASYAERKWHYLKKAL